MKSSPSRGVIQKVLSFLSAGIATAPPGPAMKKVPNWTSETYAVVPSDPSVPPLKLDFSSVGGFEPQPAFGQAKRLPNPPRNGGDVSQRTRVASSTNHGTCN